MQPKNTSLHTVIPATDIEFHWSIRFLNTEQSYCRELQFVGHSHLMVHLLWVNLGYQMIAHAEI